MLRIGHAKGSLIPVLMGLAVLGGPRPSEACEPLTWSADIVLPPAEDPMPVPTNAALLAMITAPNGWEEDLSLTTMDGVEVPLSVVVETTSSDEYALVHAFPRGELAPQTEYVWSMGPGAELRMVTTGEAPDTTAPTPGEPVVTFVETGIAVGCTRALRNVYDLEVPDPGEPVATYAVVRSPMPTPERPYEWIDVAHGTSLRVAVYEDAEICFEVRVMDYGGNAATAGTVCLEGPLAGEGSSGDETGSDGTGSDGTGSDGTTGEPAGTDEGGEGSTTELPASTTSDTDTTPAQEDETVDGCACAASEGPNRGALLLLPLLLALRGARTRSRR